MKLKKYLQGISIDVGKILTVFNVIKSMRVPNFKLEMFHDRHIDNCKLYNEFIIFCDILEWRIVGFTIKGSVLLM